MGMACQQGFSSHYEYQIFMLFNKVAIYMMSF